MKRKLKCLVISLFLLIPASVHNTAHSTLSQMSRTDLKCAMDNVYHEARGEPLRGQVAVAKVVLNRNASICKTVYAKYQFSWTNNYKEPIVRHNYQTFQAVNLAFRSSFPARYYHAVSVRPAWASRLEYVATINNHVFYK